MRFKIKFFIILFFFYSGNLYSKCNFNTANHLVELDDPKSIENISIKIKNNVKFYTNFLRILKSDQIIHEDLKKNFKATVNVKYKFGNCQYKARVRQTGDLLDHARLNKNQPLQSLRIKLLDGNIFNAVKFKLFIKETKNNEAEVLASIILKDLGFITPETFQINTIVNGVQNIMLFQESTSKEMLERNLRREGPLFEGDESIFWKIGMIKATKILLSRMINSDWFLKGKNSQILSLNAYHQLQLAYNNSNSMNFDKGQRMTIFPNDEKTTIFKDYFATLLIMDGLHGLHLNNRKFYYNPFSQSFEPIYYDGDFNFLKKNIKLLTSRLNRNFDKNYKYPFEYYFKDEDFKKNILKKFKSKIILLDENQINSFVNNSFENFNSNIYELNKTISKFEARKNFYDLEYKREDYIKKYNIDESIVSKINLTNKEFEVKINEVIKPVSSDYIKDLIVSNNVDQKRILYLPEKNSIFLENYFENIQEQKFLEGYILKTKNLNLDIDHNKKHLNITQSNISDWILFKEMNISDWKITFNGFKQNSLQSLEQRINEYGITGCLNFYKVNFDNTEFRIENSSCEDAINIVNSKGNIEKLIIFNSNSDALDADFSELNFKNININGAKNDCADFSAGKYNIHNSLFQNCGDKALSIGEKSIANIDNIIVKNSKYGVASKDGSQTFLNNSKLEELNICYAAYRKKQEFFGSHLKLKNNICKNYVNETEFDLFSNTIVLK